MVVVGTEQSSFPGRGRKVGPAQAWVDEDALVARRLLA